jgi:adenine deaminase
MDMSTPAVTTTKPYIQGAMITQTKISGHIVDVHGRRIFKGVVCISEGIITSITETDQVTDQFILPGFIDSHIHIESSMVTPFEFAKTALSHGTIATVSDPHEIANVCGMEGINFMIASSRSAGIKFFFGAPSCVPATSFETAGAVISPADIETLLSSDEILYLSEMMNYPGVLHEDPEVMAKIHAAVKRGKPIDGHAPGLRGEEAKKYIDTGISTDHECTTLEEAMDKINHGMKIIIREGSAAKNFEALHPLIGKHPDKVMFCSDDKHPDDLLKGHINDLVIRALHLGYDLFDVLQIACINPIKHYSLPVGSLRVGDKADFIIVSDTREWAVTHTYIDGVLRFGNGESYIHKTEQALPNHFRAGEILAESLKVPASMMPTPVIQAIDGSLITEKKEHSLKVSDGYLQPNYDQDVLKVCVLNRYQPDSKPAVGFISGFGLKGCAIASTVAHDSHNIIAVGDQDEHIVKAINLLVASKGGLAAVSQFEERHIALPIAGLMSDLSVREVGEMYESITSFVKSRGCTLHAPFMTLSFMALLVIPKIKISDLGMFDAESFTFYN